MFIIGIFYYFQFNFVGKLLGPKGNSMKRLQEETMTKMAVLGRGSMRDKQKVRRLLKPLFVISIIGKNGLFRTITKTDAKSSRREVFI